MTTWVGYNISWEMCERVKACMKKREIRVGRGIVFTTGFWESKRGAWVLGKSTSHIVNETT
jgi:hypothetical protein